MCHILWSHAPSNYSASRTELLPWFFSCIGILPFPSLMLLRASGNSVSDALDRLKTSLSPTVPREELESFVSSGVLSHLQLSFSRDHQDGADGTGRYVQDNLKLHGRHITHILLQQKGSIYVCGWDWRRRSAAAIIICCSLCLKRVPPSTRILSTPSSRNSLYLSLLFCLCEGNVPTRLIIQSLSFYTALADLNVQIFRVFEGEQNTPLRENFHPLSTLVTSVLMNEE